MRKVVLSAIFLAALASSGQNPGRFDGTWNTTVTCEPKGGALGYTLHFVSTVSGNVLHGERGTKGQQAYLAIDGKIDKEGKAKLTATGNTASAAYTAFARLRPDTVAHQRIVVHRAAGQTIKQTAELTGCSLSQVKRIWAMHLATASPAEG
ncbi:MAG: helix-turn-helix domain-containing protein [Acidobacteriaceae bacterium]|nr:helix-turn-helix domain-containing protein [Acidobacteriaceae bacterium]